MSFGSDTDGSNSSGSVRMSRGRSSGEDASSDPQLMRVGGIKKKF